MADDKQKLEQEINNINESLNEVNQSIYDIGANLNKTIRDGFINSIQHVRQLAEGLSKSKNLSKDINNINKELNNTISKSEKLNVSRIIAQQKLNKAIQDGDKITIKKYQKELQSYILQVRINESIEDQLRKTLALAEAEKAVSLEKKKQNDLTSVLKSNLKNAFSSLSGILTTAGIFKILIDSALRFNTISVNIGKSLGYGADNSDRVTSNLVKIAQTSNNVNVTLASAGEAMQQLSESTGFVSEYSKDALETQIMLTKQFGLTGDEAAGVYKFSVLTGKSSEAVNKAMVGAFVNTRNQLKVGVPFKQVMAEAAKVSGQLAVNLQNNPELITKAIVQTKALGTTLEQTKQQGEALLDFESSIENQLKAQLLTGESLNLERARAAALAGDQISLAKELANQGMTLEKFQQLNVIAQKSYAAALGLSADQLSEQLRKQKLAIKNGESFIQLTQDEALEAEKRQTIQDKFNNAILKLQDLVGNLVAGPFGKMLSVITDIVSQTWVLSTAMAAYIGKLTYSIALNTAEWILEKRKARTNAVDASIEAGKSAAKVPVIGAVLGIAAALASFAAFEGLLSKGDDVISEGGYGKRTLLSPEGAIKLNDKDTVIAGTDLGGGNKEKQSINNNIDLTPLITAIKEVKLSVDKLYNKDSSINMDGKKVGTTLIQSSYKVA
ncbi:unnamed protein product [Wuchereria bancrofti]|uniref:Phage tail tape measure protein n=1 Tax=Wuchereria bancrofti TaxID=6293 RepID=A0A3P7DXA7_WUCBA|nr:unnamed protein product [Wuchereria bancrofti]